MELTLGHVQEVKMSFDIKEFERLLEKWNYKVEIKFNYNLNKFDYSLIFESGKFDSLEDCQKFIEGQFEYK